MSTPVGHHGVIGNRLLPALPREERESLVPSLQPMTFALGEVVYESGERQDYVYFPTTCVVSIIYTMENGSTAEMGLAGNNSIGGSLGAWGARPPPTVRLHKLRAMHSD